MANSVDPFRSSLIRVFAVCSMGAQADLSLHWAHMPFCWFYHDLAHIPLLYGKAILFTFWGDYRKFFECPNFLDFYGMYGNTDQSTSLDSLTELLFIAHPAPYTHILQPPGL